MSSKKTGQQLKGFSGFGFKLSFEKKENVGIDHIRLEHKDNGHDKFYIIYLQRIGNSINTNFSVSVTYGKSGAPGTKRRIGFKTIEDAYKFINSKLKEKLKKGYKRIINT